MPGSDCRTVARKQLAKLVALSVTCAAAAPAGAGAFGASWTGDFASNVSGGLMQDERHMGLVELSFDRAIQLVGRMGSLHLAAQHIYGGGFTEFVVGDLQTVSNIDADGGTRLFEAWADVSLAEGTSVLLGRYDLNREFDSIDSAALFLSARRALGRTSRRPGPPGLPSFPELILRVELAL